MTSHINSEGLTFRKFCVAGITAMAALTKGGRASAQTLEVPQTLHERMTKCVAELGQISSELGLEFKVSSGYTTVYTVPYCNDPICPPISMTPEFCLENIDLKQPDEISPPCPTGIAGKLVTYSGGDRSVSVVEVSPSITACDGLADPAPRFYVRPYLSKELSRIIVRFFNPWRNVEPSTLERRVELQGNLTSNISA